MAIVVFVGELHCVQNKPADQSQCKYGERVYILFQFRYANPPISFLFSDDRFSIFRRIGLFARHNLYIY